MVYSRHSFLDFLTNDVKLLDPQKCIKTSKYIVSSPHAVITEVFSNVQIWYINKNNIRKGGSVADNFLIYPSVFRNIFLGLRKSLLITLLFPPIMVKWLEKK